MPEKSRSASDAGTQPTMNPPREYSEKKQFIRSAVLFVLVGLVLYTGLYIATELLIARYARCNPFYRVKTAPRIHYDYVILGSSHAAVFDYRDMNVRLEEMTGSTILNLSTVGGGITVNRLLLEYFLVAHQTKSVVYVLDSFPFYSRKWNEERLQDRRLFLRAPWDPKLAGQLLSIPAARHVAVGYIVGFSKINNPDRFAPDFRDDYGDRFDRIYRPVEQIDRLRIEYLYREEIDERSLRDSPYLDEFEAVIRDLQSRGIRVVVVRPPIPERIYRAIPNERQFDVTLKTMLERHEVELHDFSAVNNDEQFFFDSDHLNRAGVLSFFENYLKNVLTPDEQHEMTITKEH